MANNTASELRNKTIYCIYVRNHSNEGNFEGVKKDLERIKDLGVDIIWLLPIHPIGKVNRKGTLGCPYSISDYTAVNEEYGTVEQFKELIEAIHKKDMKVIIDVVYNHTSYDSQLFKKHPEFFYQNAKGEFCSKIEDWSDVCDLDYSNKRLWDSQIEALKHWINLGVDGFRCDVAPMVPIEFWIRARKEISEIKSDVIWIAESVHTSFVVELRKMGFNAQCDAELYQAFDVTYDYDIHGAFIDYIAGRCLLRDFLMAKKAQEWIYPGNYVKLRFIENHDQTRALSIFGENAVLRNWIAFSMFEKGVALLYAGQETDDGNRPSLFEKDVVNWNQINPLKVDLIKRMISIKRKLMIKNGNYEIVDNYRNGIIEARYTLGEKILIGIFNVEQKKGGYSICLARGRNISDGIYTNLIDKRQFLVKHGEFILEEEPLIFEVDGN